MRYAVQQVILARGDMAHNLTPRPGSTLITTTEDDFSGQGWDSIFYFDDPIKLFEHLDEIEHHSNTIVIHANGENIDATIGKIVAEIYDCPFEYTDINEEAYQVLRDSFLEYYNGVV